MMSSRRFLCRLVMSGKFPAPRGVSWIASVVVVVIVVVVWEGTADEAAS